MRRSLALACLFAAFAVGVADPGGFPPAESDQPPVDREKGLSPEILTPGHGGLVSRTNVKVNGSSDCWPVMLYWEPKGSTTQPVPINKEPGTNMWTYTITDSPNLKSIKACCEQPMLPHGPCMEVLNLRRAGEMGVQPRSVKAIAAAPAAGFPTYRRGRIPLRYPFPYSPAGIQSVYVEVENVPLTDQRSDRSQAAKAEIIPPSDPMAPDAEWQTCFTILRPGFYVIKALIVSRNAQTETMTDVIRVVP